jgi:prepilin-type N-terminal cleavage/methylation domain-containing protein
MKESKAYTILEMLFVIVLLGVFMMIAYQQIQQSNYRRNLATLHGSVNSVQSAMIQYFYEHCSEVYDAATTSIKLSDLDSYYPSSSTAAVSNPFNTNDPQDFKLSFTRAIKNGAATTAKIVVQFPSTNSKLGILASAVRPTEVDYGNNTMTWIFSPFRAISDVGVPQSSRASLAVYNIWTSGKPVPGAEESCDYKEYYQQTQASP